MNVYTAALATLPAKSRPPTPVDALAPDLPDVAGLVTAIRREHRAVQDALRDSVAHAIRCGELLLQAKKNIPHGEWSAWLTGNVKFSDTAARGYMRLAAMDEAKRQRVADMTLRAALKAVADEFTRKQKQIERDVDRELRQAAVTHAQPSKTNVGGHTVIDAEVIETTPKPIAQSAPATVIDTLPHEPEPIAKPHIADADEVQGIVDQIKANLADADLLQVVAVGFDAIVERRLHEGHRTFRYAQFSGLAATLKGWARSLRKVQKRGHDATP